MSTNRVVNGDAFALSRILESLPSFVLLIDREGVVRYINRLEPGFTRDHVIGQSARSFVTPDTDVLLQSALHSVLENGEPAQYEARVPLPDGSIARYRSRMLPLWDGDRVSDALLIGTNVTGPETMREEAGELHGLLPLCAWCERVQTDEGSWVTVEEYLTGTTGVRITYGMCPDCYRRQTEGGEG